MFCHRTWALSLLECWMSRKWCWSCLDPLWWVIKGKRIHVLNILPILTSPFIKTSFLFSKCFTVKQSKKGKTTTTQREVTVVMPNGQSILVKCEVKSRGVDVFDMIVAHSNLIEHFYFGLAYIDGKVVR